MLVLVENAADPSTSPYAEASDLLRIADRDRQQVHRAGVGDALMGPMGAAEVLEFAQGVQQVPLTPDQGTAQQTPGDRLRLAADRFRGLADAHAAQVAREALT
ncbi:hypothetical protein OG758_00730 [Streptomyces sp. NBC_01474]|uniref:hypothetical protein n=1 Tax=Streptomyces sp. NBC_01474 TaxID=2903880 RepID=UPI002DD9A3E7|nr:hypothetical protein [Streptomyces sp. NBC_01474]WSD92884.1 hypothetical protein OG758_00730 [Streptomyces sp. NBC_01474]